jgi:curved DNA-binding protein CbpA
MQNINYYEFLQISPRADEETIHRVYRFLAARYHPDNPVSGNAETFSMLTTAYNVLSDPAQRNQYDIAREHEVPQGIPLSTAVDFMDNLEGETNRRLAMLAVLYFRRRSNPNAPEVSLAEIEARLGFPRDYLDFTIWYLQKKGYITKADNSDLTLTALGVDFVETQRVNIPVLEKLLTNGASPSVSEMVSANRAAAPAVVVLPPDGAKPFLERRVSTRDRRKGSRDRRGNGAPERRA